MGDIIICICISIFITIHNKLISISNHKGFSDSKYDFLFHYMYMELGFKSLGMLDTTSHCEESGSKLCNFTNLSLSSFSLLAPPHCCFFHFAFIFSSWSMVFVCFWLSTFNSIVVVWDSLCQLSIINFLYVFILCKNLQFFPLCECFQLICFTLTWMGE
jgi:hypothetical protein